MDALKRHADPANQIPAGGEQRVDWRVQGQYARAK